MEVHQIHIYLCSEHGSSSADLLDLGTHAYGHCSVCGREANYRIVVGLKYDEWDGLKAKLEN